MATTDWRERAYEETYQNVLAGLEARKRVDRSFSIDDAEGTLRYLYIQDGNDQDARGALLDAKLEAAIAAHEQFIDEWRKEEGLASAQPDSR